MRYLIFILFCFQLSGQKVCMTPPLDMYRPEPDRAFGLYSKKWNKKVFYVYFFDEHDRLSSKVMYRANKWGRKNSGVKFIKTKNRDSADCRVSFNPGGSWSYVGLDNRYIPKEQPTMQLGWAIQEYYNGKELTRVVCHEFGHFLGLGHEHNHGESRVKWNKPVVYAHYRKLGWSNQETEHNVFYKYIISETNYTEYDPNSIMHYPVPIEFTLDGYSVGWNRKLSELDKKWISENYPK